MSDTKHGDEPHLDAEALDRYRRRVSPPAELLAVDAHIATCDRCYDAVRADVNAIDLPPADGHAHLTYEELEAFVDGRGDAVDRELISAHVGVCTTCASELTDLAALRDALRSHATRAPYDVRLRRPRT